MALAFEYVAAS